jgi:predicted ribosome quality control (RQC) complex YloA/Tae2 family protein
VSNLVRYDGLLARALAAELHATLAGRRVRGLLLDRDQSRAALGVRGHDGDRTLLWSLGPDGGGVRVLLRRGPRPNVPLPPGPRITGVTCAPDERVVVLHAAAAYPVRIAFELMPNALNAVATGDDDRIIGVLRPRPGGRRPLEIGGRYAPPPRQSRAGADAPIDAAAFRALLEPLDPDARAAALLRHVAWTSPLNVAYILGDVGRAGTGHGSAALDAAHARYAGLVTAPPRPVLLATPHGAQPYPHALDGGGARPFDSLIAAFDAAWTEAARAQGRAAGRTGARAGGETPADPPADALPAAVDAATAALQTRARRALARGRKRADRLRAELDGAVADAARLRADGDLLLAQLHAVRRGADHAELDDYAGGTRRVPLDPALPPSDNADRLYAAARKRARAAERLPALIKAAERDAAALAEWLTATEAGADVGPPPVELAPVAPARDGEPERRAPYRRYRTSGGLEVRVGRSGKANDALTFHHSSPNDVWLHARDAGGAHVVLRWPDAQANPPARDLAEAAVLAALNSRARTSGLVAVDWTRRKYVRKPRKARPGLVTIERAKTLFVEPDADVEQRLSAGRPA